MTEITQVFFFTRVDMANNVITTQINGFYHFLLFEIILNLKQKMIESRYINVCRMIRGTSGGQV